MKAEYILGAMSKITDTVTGITDPIDAHKPTLPEALIELKWEYKDKTAKYAMEHINCIKLNVLLMERELKQMMAVNKLYKKS